MGSPPPAALPFLHCPSCQHRNLHTKLLQAVQETPEGGSNSVRFISLFATLNIIFGTQNWSSRLKSLLHQFASLSPQLSKT